MTGAELQTLNTSIRAGRQMDDTLFYTLVNLSKSGFERMRPWRKLIKKDTSQVASPSTAFTTAFTLPTTFLMTLPRRTLKLVSSSNAVLEYVEVTFEDWELYKTSSGYFTIDHMSGQYYISGTVNATYTIYFSFISSSPAIDATTPWIFPAEFHPALAFDVAAMDELGIDYDDTNARQGNANSQRAQLIVRSAIRWDETLGRSALGV